MSRLVWDSLERPYEAGIDRGVLYLDSGLVIPWFGLTGVQEGVDNDSISFHYVDGVLYLAQLPNENYVAVIEAFVYPTEFEEYEGGKPFDFSYRSSDNKIHIVYNALAAPVVGTYRTRGKDPNLTTFEWSISTVPGTHTSDIRPYAHLVIDTELAVPEAIADLEDLLYGSDILDPSLPDPATILALFQSYARMTITDHGDGTWTADGPDDMVHMLDPTTFEIVSPSAIYVDDDTYTVSSW
jgi:hypothetical protein